MSLDQSPAIGGDGISKSWVRTSFVQQSKSRGILSQEWTHETVHLSLQVGAMRKTQKKKKSRKFIWNSPNAMNNIEQLPAGDGWNPTHLSPESAGDKTILVGSLQLQPLLVELCLAATPGEDPKNCEDTRLVKTPFEGCCVVYSFWGWRLSHSSALKKALGVKWPAQHPYHPWHLQLVRSHVGLEGGSFQPSSTSFHRFVNRFFLGVG